MKRQRELFDAICFTQGISPGQLKSIDVGRLSVYVREVDPTLTIQLQHLAAGVEAYVKVCNE